MSYRYRMNTVTGLMDIVGKTVGSGTTPTNQKTVYTELLTTGTTFAHNANAQWTGAEVLIMELTDYYTIVNELKTDYNLHRADAAQHLTGVDGVHVVTAADASDWATLVLLMTDLVTQYDLHDADANLGIGWAYHDGQNTITHSLSIPAITYANAHTSLIAIKTAYNAHDNDAASHGAVGSHQIVATNPALVWNDSLYVPRQDPADVLNSAIIDSVVSDMAKITFYF